MKAARPPHPAPPIRVGPAGWAYADWEGRVYPRPHPRGFQPLRYLSSYVDLVEVNSTFYAVPPPARAERWVEWTADRPDFRFLTKLHRDFTHGPAAAAGPAAAGAYLDAIRPLREAGRLVAVLAQFPFFFRHDEAGRERLQRLADLFPDLPLVVELRRRDWFGDEGLGLLERLGLGLAHVDLPPARDHPPARHACVGEIGYVRLHGRNAQTWFDAKAGRDDRYDYLYGPEELDGIVERLREVARHSSRETVLVTNNHYGGQAVANALEIRHAIEGRRPAAPGPLVEAFPHLREIVRPEGQQSLF